MNAGDKRLKAGSRLVQGLFKAGSSLVQDWFKAGLRSLSLPLTSSVLHNSFRNDKKVMGRLRISDGFLKTFPDVGVS